MNGKLGHALFAGLLLSLFSFSGFAECVQFSQIPSKICSDSVSKVVKPKRHKLISAILAFPIPFGMLGLHRIYLGTRPYIPLMYILSFGGGFFITPFVDFISILKNKEMTQFENNPKFFMWKDE